MKNVYEIMPMEKSRRDTDQSSPSSNIKNIQVDYNT